MMWRWRESNPRATEGNLGSTYVAYFYSLKKYPKKQAKANISRVSLGDKEVRQASLPCSMIMIHHYRY